METEPGFIRAQNTDDDSVKAIIGKVKPISSLVFDLGGRKRVVIYKPCYCDSWDIVPHSAYGAKEFMCQECGCNTSSGATSWSAAARVWNSRMTEPSRPGAWSLHLISTPIIARPSRNTQQWTCVGMDLGGESYTVGQTVTIRFDTENPNG